MPSEQLPLFPLHLSPCPPCLVSSVPFLFQLHILWYSFLPKKEWLQQPGIFRLPASVQFWSVHLSPLN